MKDIEAIVQNNIEIELYEMLDRLGEDIESMKKRQAAKSKLRSVDTVEKTVKLCCGVFGKLGDYASEQFRWVLTESAVVSESKLNALRSCADRMFNKLHSTANQHLARIIVLADKPGLHKRHMSELNACRQKELQRIHIVLGDVLESGNNRKMIGLMKAFFGKR